MNAAAALLLASLAASPSGAAPAKPPAPKAHNVRVAYEEPKEAAHRAYYESLRDRKVLERFAEVIGTIRLPYELALAFAGCDGESNAWYDPEEHKVTFCYEMVADFDKAAPGAGKYGISHEDAVNGPVVFVFLHETGHALFHLLQVPVLGREEDAADNVAAYILLRAGKPVARRVLTGAAWMYKHDASSRQVDESDFSDVHGLDVQRFYNVLCMAYGSEPAAYRGMVERGYLPKDRADGCEEEFAQVGFAVRRLISPSLDPKAVESFRKKRAQREAAPAQASSPPKP
jgi:hypothetical protein